MKRDITTFFIVTAKYRIDTHKNSMLINKNTKKLREFEDKLGKHAKIGSHLITYLQSRLF